MTDLFNKSEAIFSPDRKYRYVLRRTWDERLVHMVFIMLNPSDANEDKDDSTIRRCIGFAKREGFGGIEVVNLFAKVSSIPHPAKGWTPGDIGPENNEHLLKTISLQIGRIVVAWGANAPNWRVDELDELFKLKGIHVYCLGVTKDGCPRHPLYVRADEQMQGWSQREGLLCDGLFGGTNGA